MRQNRSDKVAVAAASAVTGTLLIGLGISVWQSIEKSKAYHRAQTEAAKSQQVAGFLKDMIRAHSDGLATAAPRQNCC